MAGRVDGPGDEGVEAGLGEATGEADEAGLGEPAGDVGEAGPGEPAGEAGGAGPGGADCEVDGASSGAGNARDADRSGVHAACNRSTSGIGATSGA
jgi:hypothetical protein